MNLLERMLMKKDKRYLEELVKPINERSIILENDMQYLKEDVKEIKEDYRNIRKDMRYQLLGYIGLTISVIGIATAGYISSTNRIDDTQKMIYQMQKEDLERDQKLYGTVNEINQNITSLTYKLNY